MDKVISVVQSGNTIQVAHKTILGKYMALADAAGGELSVEKLYKFLSGENARVINRCKADGSLDEQTLEECKVFSAFYVNRISQQTRRSISSRFGGLPLLLRMGVMELSKSSDTFPWNNPLDLTDDQLRQVGTLVKYVESLDANRIAVIRITDPDSGQEIKDSIPLARDMTSERVKTRRSLFLAYVGYMVQYEGRMILRLCISEKEYIVMGFQAVNGKLRPLTGEQMKSLYNNPNAPKEARQNVTFKTPAWH